MQRNTMQCKATHRPARASACRPPRPPLKHNTQYSTTSAPNTTPTTQRSPCPAQHPLLNSLRLQRKPHYSTVPPIAPPAARGPPPSTQQRPCPTKHPLLNSPRPHHSAHCSTTSVSNTAPATPRPPRQAGSLKSWLNAVQCNAEEGEGPPAPPASQTQHTAFNSLRAQRSTQ